jgi:hypothetical protein
MFPRQPYGFPQAARNDYMAEGGASEGCECALITVRLTKSSAAQYLTDVTRGSDRHVPLRSSPGRRTKGALAALLTMAYTVRSAVYRRTLRRRWRWFGDHSNTPWLSAEKDEPAP